MEANWIRARLPSSSWPGGWARVEVEEGGMIDGVVDGGTTIAAVVEEEAAATEATAAGTPVPDAMTTVPVAAEDTAATGTMTITVAAAAAVVVEEEDTVVVTIAGVVLAAVVAVRDTAGRGAAVAALVTIGNIALLAMSTARRAVVGGTLMRIGRASVRSVDMVVPSIKTTVERGCVLERFFIWCG